MHTCPHTVDGPSTDDSVVTVYWMIRTEACTCTYRVELLRLAWEYLGTYDRYDYHIDPERAAWLINEGLGTYGVLRIRTAYLYIVHSRYVHSRLPHSYILSSFSTLKRKRVATSPVFLLC